MGAKFTTTGLFLPGVIALVVAAIAVPASATLIEVSAGNGTYKVIYESTLQVPGFTAVSSASTEINVSMNAGGVGVQDPDGAANGILQTVFTDHQILQFVPTPGYQFTSLAMSTGVVGFHHGYFGGHAVVIDGVITATSGQPGPVVLAIPTLSNSPNWGQGGGGAYSSGLFGTQTPTPPSGGFTLDMTETVILNDDSSLGWNLMVFDLQTVAVPEPATGTLMLLGLGMMGFVARRRINQL